MPDPEREWQDLVRAEADIVAGEERLSRQEALVAELQRDGHDTKAAKVLLETLRRTLDEWRTHRAQIIRHVQTAQERSAKEQERSAEK